MKRYEPGPLLGSLSESPMPIRSGAMQRPSGCRCGSTLRQRYDEAGLPCNSRMGSPCPTSRYAISRPRTRRRCFWYGNAAEIMFVMYASPVVTDQECLRPHCRRLTACKKRRFRCAPDIAEVAGRDDLAQFGLARLRTKRRADVPARSGTDIYSVVDENTSSACPQGMDTATCVASHNRRLRAPAQYVRPRMRGIDPPGLRVAVRVTDFGTSSSLPRVPTLAHGKLARAATPTEAKEPRLEHDHNQG